MREVFDRMNDWQRISAYSTFGLNAFFLLWGLLYCICKCCCCCRNCQRQTVQKRKDKDEKSRLVASEDSSRLELTSTNPAKVPPLIKHDASLKGGIYDEDEVHKA